MGPGAIIVLQIEIHSHDANLILWGAFPVFSASLFFFRPNLTITIFYKLRKFEHSLAFEKNRCALSLKNSTLQGKKNFAN